MNDTSSHFSSFVIQLASVAVFKIKKMNLKSAILFLYCTSFSYVFTKVEVYLSEGLDECGMSYPLEKLGPIRITSPNYGKPGKTYGPNLFCNWAFIGKADCTPALSCSKFELQNLGNDCSGEHLEVTDGTGIIERFCGKSNKILTPVKGKSRDLYIKFNSGKTMNKTIHAGFSCDIKCYNNIGKVPRYLVPTQNSAFVEDQRCICGLQNKDDRIVGGVSAELNEFPWQAAVVMTGTRIPVCSGSLINDRYILTAAHCFRSTIPSTIEVLLHARILEPFTSPYWDENAEFGQLGWAHGPGFNETVRTDEDEKTQRFKVASILSHPHFTLNFDYDVALLKLEKKIDLSHPQASTPICLPGLDAINETFIGTVPWVSGWGLGHEFAGATTRILQKVDVPVIPSETCKKWMKSMTIRMLCAGYEKGEKDACAGDSGSSLSLLKKNNQWQQIGIVSFGIGCARKENPGFYSRITELNSWIKYNSEGAIWCKSNK